MSTIQLHKGDCLEIMKSIPDKSVDMILCDLPYGKTKCKWDVIIPFDKLWVQYERIIKDNGAIVLFGKEPFTSRLILSQEKLFRYKLTWKKERPTNPMLCKKQYPQYCEDICVFYKKQPTFNPQHILRKPENKRNNKPRGYTDRTKGIADQRYTERVLSGANDYIYQPDILEFAMERGIHETQKPVKLMMQLIKTYTNEGETVLDNCMGNGSTGVACKNTNRNFIGIELQEEYFEIAKQRINEAKSTLTQLTFFTE